MSIYALRFGDLVSRIGCLIAYITVNFLEASHSSSDDTPMYFSLEPEQSHMYEIHTRNSSDI